MSKWFGKGKNDAEASGSGSGRRRRRRRRDPSPSPPPPPSRSPSPPPSTGNRIYVPAHQCRHYWRYRCPLPWAHVGLPCDWRLSRDRVPVPPNLAATLRHHLPQPPPFGLGYQWEGVNTFPVTVSMPPVPLDATDEEEARLKEEAYTRQLAAERAEAEYAETRRPVVVNAPPPDRAARRAAREAEHAAARAAFQASFPWAEPPPPYIDLGSDEDDDMGGGADA